MKAIVDIDESLLRLASERTGQTEKSALVNMGLRALVRNTSEQIKPSEPAIPIVESNRRRTLGGWEDIWIAKDFDDTPEDIIRYFTEGDV